MTLILIIIILLVVFGGGGGWYYGNRTWGPQGGLGLLGLVLVICLVIFLLSGHRL